MPNVTVTMLQTRRGEDGNWWNSGTSYSASEDFARFLITANLATGTLPDADKGIDALGRPVGTASVSGDGTLRRRPMIGLQLCPQNAAGVLQTNGTVTETASAHPFGPRAYSISVPATSAAVRAFFAQTINGLDTNAFYALTVDVANVVRQAGSSWNGWCGTTALAAEASQPEAVSAGLVSVTAMPPAIGLNGYVFRPASSSVTVRIGIGGISNATAIAGDMLQIRAVSVVRVDGLTSPLPPYARSFIGPVGYDAVATARHAGSCILAVGDSWSNDPTDWPGLLSDTYGREVIQSAVAGHTTAQMLARLQLIGGNTDYLYHPNFNAPGMAWICGALNDRIGGASGAQMIAGVQALVDWVQARGMRAGIIIQTDCTDSSHYTAARAQAWGRFANWVMSSGLPFVDSRTVLQNADGTANATNMLSETGAWIHPSAAGHAALAALVDAEQRRVDLAGAVGAGRWVA